MWLCSWCQTALCCCLKSSVSTELLVWFQRFRYSLNSLVHVLLCCRFVSWRGRWVSETCPSWRWRGKWGTCLQQPTTASSSGKSQISPKRGRMLWLAVLLLCSLLVSNLCDYMTLPAWHNTSCYTRLLNNVFQHFIPVNMATRCACGSTWMATAQAVVPTYLCSLWWWEDTATHSSSGLLIRR